MIINVVVLDALGLELTYESKVDLARGDIVVVDIRGRKSLAVVMSTNVVCNFNGEIKSVSAVLPYSVPAEYLDFAKFVSSYNLANYSRILKLIIPFKEDFLLAENRPRMDKKINAAEINLSDEQQRVYEELTQAKNEFNVSLLHGITGSGKTLVFLKLIKELLRDGGQFLILVPEIALSKNMAREIEKYTGIETFIWHNSISKVQKKNIWTKAASNNTIIVVGARSALFMPFPNLKLIVIDEEHDSSFKQDEAPIYHARDMATYLAKLKNIPIILSSATPSVESYHNAKIGKYKSLSLNTRFTNASLPTIKVVDMREANRGELFAEETLHEIKNTLDRGKQVLVFINRRGYAPMLICTDCGKKIECPGCSACLSFHKFDKTMVCHYCGFKTRVASSCSDCGGDIIAYGVGVEKACDVISGKFKSARVLRVSSDYLNTPNKIDTAFKDIDNGTVDIIVGTQIVSKGHNFENLELVVVLNADSGLTGEDLRSKEKIFQIITQVSGRAGRFSKNGSTVIMQTFDPESKFIQILKRNNQSDFYEDELQTRKKLHMPPFGKMATITISSLNESAVKNFAALMKRSLPSYPSINVLGPIEPSIYKLNSRYRLRFLILGPQLLNDYIKNLTSRCPAPKNIRVVVDIDPQNF